MREVFLKLLRFGIGAETVSGITLQDSIDWEAIKALAEKQGLNAVVLDGVEKLPEGQRPPKVFLLQWIGEVLQDESNNAVQQKEAGDMALLFHGNYIRTYVLKGAVVAECYPKPEHRASVDMDCFLLPEKGEFDAWALGNDLMKTNGFEVSFDFYKNSTFSLPGLTVENHKFFTPFRGNKNLEYLEVMLQGMMKEDLDGSKGSSSSKGSRIGDTWLYRPPVMVTALFLIEHAYSHFLHEGLTWKMVLDWMMYSRKHKDEIEWNALDAQIDEYGFRKFYDSYFRLGQYLLVEIDEADLSELDKRMLKDICSELTLPASGGGLKNKLSIARNTFQARWKYRYFAEISMLQALLIQVKGFFFIKNPTLN